MTGISRAAKAVLVTVTTFGLFTVGAPAAQAAGDTITGGCFAATIQNTVLTNGQNQGVIGDVSSTRDANGPAEATVQCWIEVNSVEQSGTRHAYSGTEQSGVDEISFSAFADDTVEVCEDVHFFTDGLDTGAVCRPSVNRVIIPEPVIGPINEIFPNTIDPLLCPALADLHGNYGIVTIGSDGDIFVLDPLGVGYGLLYDCPPY